MENPKIIKLADVMKKTTLSKSNIYKAMQKGKFPRPIKIADKLVAWIDAEVEEWLMSKIERR